jgi:hypothetical protein
MDCIGIVWIEGFLDQNNKFSGVALAMVVSDSNNSTGNCSKVTTQRFFDFSISVRSSCIRSMTSGVMEMAEEETGVGVEVASMLLLFEVNKQRWRVPI